MRKVDGAGLLIEDADERRMFNQTTKIVYGGNALAHIATALHLMAKLAPEGGSYGDTLAIYSNECLKASRALSPPSPDKSEQ